MKRVLLLAVAACGPHPAPTPASPVELAVKLQRDPEREVDPVLDIKAGMASSIADVWTAHEPRVQPPLVDAGEPVEHDRVAIAVPRARVPGRRAPCFANRDVLVGSEVWSDLDHYAIGMSSEEPASGTYGTCTIKNGQLRDAHGTLVAEIHCGITVYVPGILDHLGFEIGARGSDIAAEHATQDAICWHDFRDDDVAKHTRCSFSDGSHYSVAGVAAAMPEHGPLRGAAARGFFTSRTVSHFTVRMSCH